MVSLITHLNVSPEAITVILSGIMVLVGSIIIGWNAYKKEINLYWFFFLSFLSFSIAIFLMGISILLLNILANRIDYIFMVISLFFLIIGIDYSKRETVDPFKMLYIGVLGSFMIYFAFQPDAFVESTLYGYPSIDNSEILRITVGIFLLSYGFFLCRFILLIYLKSPKDLKKYSLIMLIGSGIVGVITPLFIVFTDLIFTLPIGVLIMAIAFAREPKILYILPFKADRLIVINNSDGISLYDFKWADTNIDEFLISGLLQAVRKISIEVLGKGDVEEIILKDGVLIFYQTEKITVGLLASKTSKYLKDCIEKFAKGFEKKYDKELIEAQKYVERNNFISAVELINKFFEFVPSRIEIN